MKNNTYDEYIKPVVVLVVICLVVTTLLALTYSVANPIIIKNTKAAADKTRTELLSQADSFTKYDGKLKVEEAGKVYVDECYTANNKSGIVCTVKTKSFGGLLTMMVGIDKNGKITGVSVTNHSDTPGVGTKDMEPDHLNQYKGLDKLKSTNIKSDDSVQTITGASVTGSAIHYGVYCALDQYKLMGGVK
ncbi:FMN-binding protein [Eubacterium pyruvativorans]|uniref:FMN-binding protein n=1 Tax=Eubacterium pyruvativorans TaxID=155865 RepID=UPI00088D8CE7|nr:FMN-binding protein [Eubacterium pyruvativorans]SDE92226.1 electron transport complex protein RnfG [Eubacterium pyruvativorans]HAT82939.1 FMN-binding protein [Eubacterium sp.]